MYQLNSSQRKPGTKTTGRSFNYDELREIFNKGAPVTGLDSNEYRLDTCGALMKFSDHGKRVDGNLGWEVDHITPVSKGGSDYLSNLQPLQWQNNLAKSDGPNANFCAITYK